MLWDIFCKVIDNHGDLGVGWRLSAELAARGDHVRLWVDEPLALAWMAPQGRPGVQVIRWDEHAPDLPAGDVVIEAFGCDPPPAFVQSIAARAAQGPAPAWINLEYLSAEPYVERCHLLPSPVGSGPARGLVKRFFYPGFTARTGGLLRETDLAARQAAFDRERWRLEQGLPRAGERLVSLFCYEPPALPELLAQLAAGTEPTRLMVTQGRATAAARQAMDGLQTSRPGWNAAGRLAVTWLPLMPQEGYDELLWACDLNFVRGEDSLTRALWAGRPFVWHIYPQDDGAHEAKLEAFLDWLEAPASLRALHRAWNGPGASLPGMDLGAWTACSLVARSKLQAQGELVANLRAAALSPPAAL